MSKTRDARGFYGLPSKGSDDRLVKDFPLQEEFYKALVADHRKGADRDGILLRMRILREALICSHRSDEFSSKVFKFCADTAIDLDHVETLLPALRWLLYDLQPSVVQSDTERERYGGYLVLYLLTTERYNEAYEAMMEFHVQDPPIRKAGRAVLMGDWCIWRDALEAASCRQRCLLARIEEKMRRHCIRVIAKAYFTYPKAGLEHALAMKFVDIQKQFCVSWTEEEVGRDVVVRIRKPKR